MWTPQIAIIWLLYINIRCVFSIIFLKEFFISPGPVCELRYRSMRWKVTKLLTLGWRLCSKVLTSTIQNSVKITFPKHMCAWLIRIWNKKSRQFFLLNLQMDLVYDRVKLVCQMMFGHWTKHKLKAELSSLEQPEVPHCSFAGRP